MKAKLKAPHIEQILTQAKGDLQGSVQLRGSHEFPKIDATLLSNELHYLDQVTLSGMKLEAHSDGTPAQAIHAQIESKQIAVQNQLLEDISLNIDGTLKQHQFNTKLNQSLLKKGL